MFKFYNEVLKFKFYHIKFKSNFILHSKISKYEFRFLNFREVWILLTKNLGYLNFITHVLKLYGIKSKHPKL